MRSCDRRRRREQWGMLAQHLLPGESAVRMAVPSTAHSGSVHLHIYEMTLQFMVAESIALTVVVLSGMSR
jgi:hypothetical protein